ncbi:MAG TPA: hypothetical protein VGD21_00855 [Lysobacter sp.]
MDPRYASRKFILTCVLIFMAATAFALGLITPEQFIDYTKWLLGLYLAGNVGDTYVTKEPRQ